MKKIITKNKPAAVIVILSIIILCVYPQIREKMLLFTLKNVVNFMFMITPVFICIGLLEVWVDKEKMIKIMGDKSGVRGALTGFLFGLVTAVPIYALLPVAGIMLKKRCKITNILIFICSSASIRIPLVLFEISYLGWKFALTLFCINIFIILCIAYVIEKLLTESDKISIYKMTEEL